MTEEELSDSQKTVLNYVVANADVKYRYRFLNYDPQLEVRMAVDYGDESSATEAPAVEDGREGEEATAEFEVEYAYHLIFSGIEFITMPPNPSIVASVRDNFTWRLKLRVKGHPEERVVDIPINRDQTRYPLFESFDISRNYFVNQDKGFMRTPTIAELEAASDFDRNAPDREILHTSDKFQYKVYYRYVRTEIPREETEAVVDGGDRSSEAPTTLNLIANINSMELHKMGCPYVDKILAENKRIIPADEVELYLYTAYDGCAYCFPEEHYK